MNDRDKGAPEFPPGPGEMPERNSPRGLVPTSEFADLDTPYVEFLNEVNPREDKDAQFALAASTDKRFREFIEVANSPKYKRWSLATIAKKLDITLPEFANFWAKAGQAAAMARAARGLAAMTDDMLADAASKSEACERCDALGWVAAAAGIDPAPDGYRFMGDGPEGERWARTCPVCQGAKRLRAVGDAHARDKILAMNGIGQKGSGVVVAINNYAGMGIESAGNRMSSVAFEVDGPVIDGVAEGID